MTAPTFSNPKSVAAPQGAYSHVAQVKAGADTYYISGQVGFAPDGSLPADFEGQADQCFANIVRILTDLGMTAANIAKLTIYVVQGHPPMAARAARLKAFGPDVKPASTLVMVPGLVDPKFLIEIEAVAAR
jgi:enamine deaminase RidA (YjgF/YER057c/UK114 family)